MLHGYITYMTQFIRKTPDLREGYLFENTYQLIVEHPDDSVQSLFTKIQAIPNCIVRCPDFDALSLKYFISVVKDGVQQ